MSLPPVVSNSFKLLALALALAPIWLLFECFRINDKIDRCDDPSSGKYITDDEQRLVECPENSN